MGNSTIVTYCHRSHHPHHYCHNIAIIVMIAGAEVPHPGLERRDPAGADARDGVDQVFNISKHDQSKYIFNKTKRPL